MIASLTPAAVPRLPPDIRRSEGFALIEALVSAVLLLVVMFGVFSVVDTSGEVSGRNKSQSVEAGLAEQDQERLRSFRVQDLANHHETRTVTEAGVPYTVVSSTDFVTDADGGEVSCSSASRQGDYLRLTSTVSGPQTTGRAGAMPVVVRSLVAPPVGAFGPNFGTLAVKAVDHAGAGVAGVGTTITGPKTLTGTTNDVGCAVFGYVPAGSYAVALNASGYVDKGGDTTATGSGTVSAGTVNLVSLDYDKGASVDVTFDTLPAGASGPVPAAAPAASAANSMVPASTGPTAHPGVRLFPDAATQGPQQPSVDATGLFPFTTPYAVYAGDCPAANPATYAADYFSHHPGSVAVAPGGSGSVTVREPAMNLALKAAAGSTVTVKLSAADTGCSDAFATQMTAPAGTFALAQPGLPFGRWNVCADDAADHIALANVDDTQDTGTAVQPLDLTQATGRVAGACP